MIALGIFGGHGNGNAVHLRWLEYDGRDDDAKIASSVCRVSAQYDNAEAAWWHRRQLGERALIVEEIDLSEIKWAWYASMLHAAPDDVPTAYSRYSLDRYVRQDQVVDAIREYTRLRAEDGESLLVRARRLLGRSECRRDLGSCEAIRDGFASLDKKRTVRANGREWMRARGRERHIKLLEASAGYRFSERRLRRNLNGFDL